MARGKKQDAISINAAERRQRALDLRKAALSYRAIGKALGVSEFQAHTDVKTALAELKELEHESAEELRSIELERLDAMQAVMQQKALKGDAGAVDRVLRIMERRAKLLGMDAPVKQEITGKDGGAIEINGVTSEQHDRALSTLADALGTLLSRTGDRGDGAVDTAE